MDEICLNSIKIKVGAIGVGKRISVAFAKTVFVLLPDLHCKDKSTIDLKANSPSVSSNLCRH